MIAAKRQRHDADAVAIDTGRRLQEINRGPGWNFRLGAVVQPTQAQRLADARIVDHEGRNATLRQRPRHADEIDDLLGDIEAVKMNHAGCIARRVLRYHEKCGQGRIEIGHVDAAAVLSRQRQETGKTVERLAVGFLARCEIRPLHPLRLNERNEGAAIFSAGAEQPPVRLVRRRLMLELGAEHGPILEELFRGGIVALLRQRPQRPRGVIDVADAAAHAERKIDRHVPGVVILEVFEHFFIHGAVSVPSPVV